MCPFGGFNGTRTTRPERSQARNTLIKTKKCRETVASLGHMIRLFWNTVTSQVTMPQGRIAYNMSQSSMVLHVKLQ